VDFSSQLKEKSTCRGRGGCDSCFSLVASATRLAGPFLGKGDDNCIDSFWLSDAMSLWGDTGMQSQPSTRTWRAENTLDYLQVVLKELENVGDFTAPSIANLRRLIAQRISSLEALQTTGVFGATVKYENSQGVPL
jgi:hypothetical protein